MRNQQDFPSSSSRLVSDSQLYWNDLAARDGPKCLPDLSSRSSVDSHSTWCFTSKCLTDFIALCLDHCESWLRELRKPEEKLLQTSVLASELQKPKICGSNPRRNKKFLGAFAKFLKANVSFVTSVHLSACLPVRIEQGGSYWKDFHEIWYWSLFSKICRENSSFVKIWQE
jgi:hypothetical protein